MSAQVHQKIYYYTLVLIIITLPFLEALNSIFIGILILNWLIEGHFLPKLKRIATQPLFILFMSIYVLYLFGLIYTSNIEEAEFNLIQKLSLLIFPLIIGSSQSLSKKQVNNIFFFFILACFIASVICLIYATYRTYNLGVFYSKNRPSEWMVYHHFFYHGLSYGIGMHAIFLAFYIAVCIFGLIIHTYRNWTCSLKSRKFGLVALTVFFTLFLICLSARIIIGACLLILVIALITYFLKQKKVLLAVISIFTLLLISFASIYMIPQARQRFLQISASDFVFKNNPETNDQLAGKLNGLKVRVAKWFFTVETGKKFWFLGAGTGDAQDELQKTYLKNKFYEGAYPKFNPHNQYLHIWLEIGIPGVLCFLCTIIVALRASIKKNLYLYTIFLLLFAIFCLTESVINSQKGVVFYAFFNSIFALELFNHQNNNHS